MRFMESLENMESSLEKGLENIENPKERTKNNQKEVSVLSFDKKLEVILDTCRTLGEIKEFGEDIEAPTLLALDELNSLLSNSDFSIEEKEKIIDKAYSLIGYKEVNQAKRSR